MSEAVAAPSIWDLAKKMQAKLEQAGIPHKEIQCYGDQIVVTAWSRNAADKWASLLSRFATVRRIVETIDCDKVNTNTTLRPSTHKVVRVFARI